MEKKGHPLPTLTQAQPPWLGGHSQPTGRSQPPVTRHRTQFAQPYHLAVECQLTTLTRTLPFGGIAPPPPSTRSYCLLLGTVPLSPPESSHQLLHLLAVDLLNDGPARLHGAGQGACLYAQWGADNLCSRKSHNSTSAVCSAQATIAQHVAWYCQIKT